MNYAFAMLAGTLVLTACAPGTQYGAPPVEAQRLVDDGAAASLPVSKYIKHVVIVVQENRSFDNLFHGYPGALSARYGYFHNGTKVELTPGILRGIDIWHDWAQGITAWDHGRMDGFNLLALTNGQQGGAYPYRYVPQSLVEPYWTMASQYVLADHMFPTMFGPSFTGHLDLIAGTTDLDPELAVADGPDKEPWGCDAPPGTTTSEIGPSRTIATGPFPCYTQFRTMAYSLDNAHLSWKYYAPPFNAGTTGWIWTEFDAIRYVRYGADWKRNIVTPETKVLTDAAAGHLPAVSWVIPDAADSDHVSGGNQRGPSWVAAVVNAIGSGPDWKTTAIVVVWDDWGGWYDSVPPPQVDFRGLGIRVPCLIISPYAKKHYVSHTVYEFGSVLRLVEEVFALSPLGTLADGYTDVRANSMLGAFDFTQAPRAFKPIPAPFGGPFFLTRPPSMEAPDWQ